MKIRTKLQLLLLFISLLPVLAIVLLTRISIKQISLRISNDIQSKELQDTVEGVKIHVHNYREAIVSASNSLRLALQLQANEIQERLATPAQMAPKLSADQLYGFDNTLSMPPERWQKKHPLSDELDFQSQQFFLPAELNPVSAQLDIDRLWTMSRVYHDLYQANRGRTLWHYTILDNGFHTGYPGRNNTTLPDDYDLRKQNLYQMIKENSDGEIAGQIRIDAVTKKVVLTAAMSVFRPEKTFAGVTAIDYVIDDIFEGLQFPAALEGRTGLFLVGLGRPEEPIRDELVVFWSNQKDRQEIQHRTQEGEADLPELVSSDKTVFAEMLKDMKAETAGLRTMEYNGQKAIWCYSDRIGRKAALVMVIPYDQVLELAHQTQAALLDENIRQLRIAGVLILAIIAAAVGLSWVRARKFTKPIDCLTAAANTLAQGDYSAKADIQTGDELQRLAEVFNEIGPKLAEHEKTQRSLALARAIQQNLLPQRAPKLAGFEIAGRCRYCDATGGDYFDFIHLPDSENKMMGIVLGDVTGHGVGAALLMASARSILRNVSLHFTGDLAELMSQFNNQLSEDTGDDKFMTLFYGALNGRNRTLTWASGGHDPALWYHSNKDTFEELPNTGPLTGYMKNMPYEQGGPVTLEIGDVLLVGTDGIWEAENPSGQPYGQERLRELIQASQIQSAEQIADAVIQSVEDFCVPAVPEDDITLIVIKAV